MTPRGAYKPRRSILVPKSLGQRITAIRVAFAMSQAAFAEAIGASQQSLGLWETDRSKPSAPAMASLCRLTGMTKEAFLEGVGFEIPMELPGLAPVPTPPMTSGVVMAIEDGNPKPISLPAGRPGEIWGVDPTKGEEHVISPEDAADLLKEAAASGAEVWVVVRSKPKRNAPQKKTQSK